MAPTKKQTPAVAPAAALAPETPPVTPQVPGNETPAAAVVAPAEAPAAAPAAEETVEVNGETYTKDTETGALVGMKADAGSNPRLSPSEFVTDPVRDTTKATPRIEVKTQSGSVRRDY